MNLGAAWLLSDQGPPAEVAGVPVPVWSTIENAPFPTRRSEFRWVATQMDKEPPSEYEWIGLDFSPPVAPTKARGRVLDAGSGFNPEIHLMPYILGNLGFFVKAVDANPISLQMPLHEKVQRFCGDLCNLTFPPKSFDYWVCVSVLEHMELEEKKAALHEALRLLKSGGYALLTTDETAPSLVNSWLAEAGFAIGPSDDTPPKEPLSPRVAWAIARKP